MLRHCIVEIATGTVVNVFEYEDVVSGQPPGLGPEFEAVRTDVGQMGWHWDGNTFTNPNPPQPSVIEPAISIVAQARLVISGGDISGVETAVGFAAALQIDTGIYWVFFTVPQPDTDYGVLPQARDGGGLFADISDQTTDYVEITVTNRSGTPVDPTQLFISVQRTI